MRPVTRSAHRRNNEHNEDSTYILYFRLNNAQVFSNKLKDFIYSSFDALLRENDLHAICNTGISSYDISTKLKRCKPDW